jgi:threonine synthase
MISKLKEWGLEEIVEDSSGNAGASVAAYTAAAGIRSRIFVPESASAGKLAQVAAYGAQLTKVPGSREATTRAALEAAANTFYAGHN